MQRTVMRVEPKEPTEAERAVGDRPFVYHLSCGHKQRVLHNVTDTITHKKKVKCVQCG